MTKAKYFFVDNNGNVTEEEPEHMDAWGGIKLESDQFSFEIGTGPNPTIITVNDWFVGSLTSRIRVVARMADAAYKS